jgi:tRNA nucleotidyltransferase (CCA-adding enzyme)
MPDYIYLLENRLSADQQNALRQLREAAREAGTILFLTGDAVRDLTSGHAVRGLEVSVHGNALNLKKTIEKLGGTVWGEDEAFRALYLCFPGTVRVDVISTHRTEYPKPGKPVFHTASIQEDLRRRDFTVNAMAISLNEGSFGLLMDPMNGAADIETKTLRLVSNYGFLDEPALLIRAARYHARLGWELDPKTHSRYENAKAEGVIEHLSAEARRQELEQIGHEEDALKVLRALEAEGWMKVLFPAWTSAKADEEKLKALHGLAAELLLQGVHADMSAAQMQLLTDGLTPKDRTALKKMMLRPGFVAEWNSLDALAARFAKVLLAKENSTPSTIFKLFTSYDPEAILWLGFTSTNPEVIERFNLFLKVWPEARQRIPHALMQEMRITPELAAYSEILHAVFLELIDGRLTTPEEFRAFLEPHSPPAPPPHVAIKRPRAKRGGEAKMKEHAYDDEDSEDGSDEDEDLDDLGGDEDDIGLGLSLPKVDLDAEIPNLIESDEIESAEDELEAGESEAAPAPLKRASETPAPSKSPKGAQTRAAEKAAKPAAAVPAAKPVPAKAEKPKAEKPVKPQPAAKPKPEVKAAPASNSVKAQPASNPKPKAKPAPAPVAKSPASAARHQASSAKPVHAAAPAKAKAAPAMKKAASAPVAAKGSKAPVKTAQAKAPAKAPVKAPVKAQSKTPVKIPVKVQAKVAAVKSASAKGKPAAKPGKAAPPAKPTKQAAKKPAAKPAKKR